MGILLKGQLNSEYHLPGMKSLVKMTISIDQKLVSNKNPKPKTFLLELPNSERMHFESTSEECLYLREMIDVHSGAI